MAIEPDKAAITTLSKQGFGLAANPSGTGSRLYLAAALPGEEVSYHLRTKKAGVLWDVACQVENPSPHRVAPKCASAPGNLPCEHSLSLCGGCTLQHLNYPEQLQLKHQRLVELFAARELYPDRWEEPLAGEPFGYRHQARIGVHRVAKKNRLLVGFRENLSNRITDTARCEVLLPQVGHLLEELASCLSSMDIAKQIAQIEVAGGDKGTSINTHFCGLI